MKTIFETVDPDWPEKNCEVIDRAAEILLKGGLVAFPTETVYGLGANALDPIAVKKIYEAKGRPSDNPLIVHIASVLDLEPLVADFTKKGRALTEAFWPGPLTVIFKKSSLIPFETSGGLDSVAVRMPLNKVSRTLLKRCGVPIAAPSANSSGKPSPTRASHVAYDLNGKIDMIIDGGKSELGLESTIVDMTSEIPAILRPGSITISQIRNVIGDVVYGGGVFSPLEDGHSPKAPGTKYTHYSPSAKITIVEGEAHRAAAEINRLINGKNNIGVLASDQTIDMYGGATFVVSAGDRDKPETIAANLFKCLRKFDYLGVPEVYSESFNESEIGDAIMNRLKKAAGYNIINAD